MTIKRVIDFARELPNITRHIEECDFVAFDTEFSGLGRQTIGAFDTPAQAYHKTIKVRKFVQMFYCAT